MSKAEYIHPVLGSVGNKRDTYQTNMAAHLRTWEVPLSHQWGKQECGTRLLMKVLLDECVN